MHKKAKFVCFNCMQPQKVKFKSVQINMKHVSYIRVKEGKNKKMKKDGKMKISILISIYTVNFAFLKVYTKFENTGSNRS